MRQPACELRLPRQFAGWVPSRPWLSVKPAGTAAIRMGGRQQLLALVAAHPGNTIDHLEALIERAGARGGCLVVGTALSAGMRETLERRGIGYLDSRGHLHLLSPGGLVHLGDLPEASSRRAPREVALGVRGVRAVQALLEAPESISLTTVARQVRLSVAQAYNVLGGLERASLVRSSGKGPAKRRSVVDRTRLLDWLAHHPAARRRESSLDAALYARKPEELWAAVTSALDRAGIRHALTGAAAASLFGIGPTSVPLSRVRIDPEVSLEVALAAIGAERTERAPNLRLLRDTGEVGVIGSEIRQGVRTAPKTRIYLDCLAERRGEDIARQFRDAALGY